jgi:enamine deaminase RidA (YjgF/YER057c/UK114 family)
MALKRIEPGKRMSSAVIHGNKVYLAGFTPDKALGKSVAEQTHDVLTDITTFAEMNSVWDAWVVPGQTPARATVEAALAAPGIDVEIMVEAALD